MVAINESTFRVIGYSENARDMFCHSPQSVPNIEKPEFIRIGVDPARTEDPALSIVEAVQSQKLTVRAISHLQSLPSGDIKFLCDAVVQDVKQLTGYDRVMVYKFHEDEHGEVLAESRRPYLNSYPGLHYPATDIPQASRFLFQQKWVRMIVDCHAISVPVIQDDLLMHPLCLVGSTLRAPHGCHAQYMANMGSVASLVVAVMSMRLVRKVRGEGTLPDYGD
ncbi:hypothetical protein ACET3Z_010449 [Daucus carota]|uniref:Phytochrome chromophore attachment site domain-containing protein n=1 Tax=Daucus carota subsp. sativus TaxID=79200 RepID=A0A161XXV9_DAUCS